jgi:Spy/CpxP family protein refolding chaperone
MNISKKLALASLLAALALAVAAPLSSAYARHGADDPAGHNAGDHRGGHGKDDPAGHR